MFVECRQVSDLQRDRQWSKRTDEESQMFRPCLLLPAVEGKSKCEIMICSEEIFSNIPPNMPRNLLDIKKHYKSSGD